MLKYLIAVGLFGLVHAQFQSGIVYLFDPTGKSQVTGNVTFTQTPNGVHVEGEVRGLASGLHGFHVHNLGNIATGCTATGGHFNPHKKTHGAPEDSNRHVGDLGNIVADQNGVAQINLTDNVIALGGQNCIIGRGVVVHEKADDLGKGGNKDSLVTGNAGGRLACGVIGVLQSSGARLSLPYGLLAIIVLIGFIL